MGKSLKIKGADFSSVKVYSLSQTPTDEPNEPPTPSDSYPNGCAYFIPLTEDSAPTKGELSVIKESTTYSAEGALFNAEGDGIAYNLDEGIEVKAVAMDFKLVNTSLSSNGFAFDLGSFANDPYAQNHGTYVWINRSTSRLASCSIEKYKYPQDVDALSDVLAKNEFHRFCIASIGGNFRLYLDGNELVPNKSLPLSSYLNKTNLIVGNAWRFLHEGKGDRAFGGYIRNVAIWTEEISESDMAELSTL